MKIVVAGSDGFLGKEVCKLLKDQNHEIIRIDLERGVDLSIKDELKDIPKFDFFIHLANLVYVPASYENPESFYRINYLTTLNALELCRKYSARLIYVSSYIYGSPQYLPVDEKHPIKPFNPYAQTKVICEALCQGYNRDFGVKCSILRPFNIFGEGQKGKLLIPEIVSQLKQGKETITLRDAKPRRDYVDVKDVARAIVYCLKDKTEINAYNVCSGKSYSVEEITKTVNELLKRKVEFRFSGSDRLMEVDETVGSYSKIKECLGWSPSIEFKKTIENILKSEEI